MREAEVSGVRQSARRVLSRRLSVADVIEIALWLAIPYLIVGLVWSFWHVEDVRRLEDLLQNRMPTGQEMVAYLLVAGLWPVYLVLPAVCGA
jgi:hypothetical protein